MKITQRKTWIGLGIAAASLTLTACGTAYNTPLGGNTTGVGAGSTVTQQYATVTDVRYFAQGTQAGGDGIAGTLIGGLLGGLAGDQIGDGRGKDVARVAGVIGGALIGRQIDRNNGNWGSQPMYRVTVRQDNGAVRNFDYSVDPGVRNGDRVRVVGDQLYR